MSTVFRCPKCRTAVPAGTRSCPTCGVAFKPPKEPRRGCVRAALGYFVTLVLLLLLASAIIYLAAGEGPFLKLRDGTIEKYEEHIGPWPFTGDNEKLDEMARKLGDVGDEVRDGLRRATAKGGVQVETEFPILQRGTFFPALYHLSGRKVSLRNLDTTFSKVTIVNDTGEDLRGVQVEVELEGFSEPAREVIDVPASKTVEVKVTPTISEKIAQVTEERPGHIRVTVKTADGKVLKESRQQIIIASRNDLYRTDFRYPLAVVFVTPNDPIIDEILTEVRQRAGGSLRGYQGNINDVRREVRAVFQVLTELGLGYRNASTSFINDRGVSGQKVYFPAESIDLESANCIDGVCLFASILEKMGLNPYFVMVEGHVFLAVELAKDRKDMMLFLETTLIGRSTFEQSAKKGGEEFREARRGKHDVVSVKLERKRGLTPFPLRMGRNDLSIRERLRRRGH